MVRGDEMKVKLLTMGVSVLLFAIAFSGCFEDKKETKNDKEEILGYIQSLINNATVGDIVFIQNGTYYENLAINKTIILTGENKENTIIDGSIEISADNVTVSNLTIKNGHGVGISGYATSESSLYWYNNSITNNIITGSSYSGISLEWAFNTTITNNIIKNNREGIWLQYAGNNNIRDNSIKDNDEEGIYISYSWENTIYRNTVEKNEYGIYFYFYGERNNIHQNTIESNRKYGIYIYENEYNDHNNIYLNNFINNTENAYDGGNNTWYNDTHYYDYRGNFWSDYEEKYPNALNLTVVWDTPYNISGRGNQDKYPLIYEDTIRFIGVWGSDPISVFQYTFAASGFFHPGYTTGIFRYWHIEDGKVKISSWGTDGYNYSFSDDYTTLTLDGGLFKRLE